jgi:hypothetical protein
MPLQGSHIPHEKLSNARERQDLNIYKVGWRCKSFEMGYYIEIQLRYFSWQWKALDLRHEIMRLHV